MDTVSPGEMEHQLPSTYSCAGKASKNTVPWPASLSKLNRPPCEATMDWLSHKPTPMPLETFKSSASLTMGVELELQLVNTYDFDLSSTADDLLELLGRQPFPGVVTPEMTQSMIEVATGIHTDHAELLAQLRRDHPALRIAVLCPPAVHVAAGTGLPYGADEFEFAGALAGDKTTHTM